VDLVWPAGQLSTVVTVALNEPTVKREEAKKRRNEGGTMMLNKYADLPREQEDIVSLVIGCAIAVHRELGPGFKESIYHRAFRLELDSRGIVFESEKPILVKYRQWSIPGQKIDLIVRGVVLVELKAVPRLRPFHKFQVQSYLRTTGLPIGLLMNFNAALLKDGLERVMPPVQPVGRAKRG
jgi:GxxExxY protein